MSLNKNEKQTKAGVILAFSGLTWTWFTDYFPLALMLFGIAMVFDSQQIGAQNRSLQQLREIYVKITRQG